MTPRPRSRSRPDGSCTGATCTASAVGRAHGHRHDAGKTGTASLRSTPGALDHLVLSPASATIIAGGSQTYTAQGFDQYDNSLGDVTARTTFTIAPDGSCTGASCTATVGGPHTVTGTDTGKTGTATLTIDAAAVDHIVISPASATITRRRLADLHGAGVRRVEQLARRCDGRDDVHDRARWLVHRRNAAPRRRRVRTR